MLVETRHTDFGFEQVKWQRLANDVFKPPVFRMLFSTLVGFGAQCVAVAFCMVQMVTISNLLDMNTRQWLYVSFFIITALFGCIAGYTSARFYKFFNGSNWFLNFFMTATLLPMMMFVASIAIDFGDFYDGNRNQIPSSERTNLMSFWICMNMPNVAIGQWIGYRDKKILPPVKPSRIARPLPSCCEVPFYAQWWFTMLVFSTFTAGCVILELWYLVTSLWRRQYYFMYFYLGVSLVMMAYVASAASIIQSYLSLSAGLYNWWWRSFSMGFFVSIPLFLFC